MLPVFRQLKKNSSVTITNKANKIGYVKAAFVRG